MHRACVLTPRCRPHHQAARKHTTQLPSPAVCLMRWSPRRGKCPIPFRGGRSPPRLLEKEKKDSTSLARSPTSRQVPFLHTSTTSPRPRPRPRPRSRPILTSPVFRPNSSSSPRDDGCYKTVRHRFCTYPGPVRLCLLPLPPVDSPPPIVTILGSGHALDFLFSSRPSLLLSLGPTPLSSLVDIVIFVLFFSSSPPRHRESSIHLMPKSTRKDPRSRP